MEPLCYVDDKPLPAKDEILRRLDGRAGREAQLEILRLLCPCRNVCRDVEVWRKVRTMYPNRIPEVGEGAHHAVISLRERARMDTQTAALLHAIGAGPGQRRHTWLWTDGTVEHPKPVRNDVPTLVELLASDDPREVDDALRALFRTDRHVASPVWREIERAQRSTNPRVRRKAIVAVRRIEERRTAAA
jgi:hypothetical protein